MCSMERQSGRDRDCNHRMDEKEIGSRGGRWPDDYRGGTHHLGSTAGSPWPKEEVKNERHRGMDPPHAKSKRKEEKKYPPRWNERDELERKTTKSERSKSREREQERRRQDMHRTLQAEGKDSKNETATRKKPKPKPDFNGMEDRMRSSWQEQEQDRGRAYKGRYTRSVGDIYHPIDHDPGREIRGKMLKEEIQFCKRNDGNDSKLDGRHWRKEEHSRNNHLEVEQTVARQPTRETSRQLENRNDRREYDRYYKERRDRDVDTSQNDANQGRKGKSQNNLAPEEEHMSDYYGYSRSKEGCDRNEVQSAEDNFAILSIGGDNDKSGGKQSEGKHNKKHEKMPVWLKKSTNGSPATVSETREVLQAQDSDTGGAESDDSNSANHSVFCDDVSLKTEVESCTASDENDEQQFTDSLDTKSDLNAARMGKIKRDSKTERLLKEWREKNKTEQEQTQQLSEEEIRIRVSRTWSTAEESKRHSQAAHLKWAKNVVRKILGDSMEDEGISSNADNGDHTGDQSENNQEEVQSKDAGLPVLTLTGDKHPEDPELHEGDKIRRDSAVDPLLPPEEVGGLEVGEEMLQIAKSCEGEENTVDSESDRTSSHSFQESKPKMCIRHGAVRKTKSKRKTEKKVEEKEEERSDGTNYKSKIFTDDDFYTKSWGEADLRNALRPMSGRHWNPSFLNDGQLYQEYIDEVQNRMIVRQSSTDNGPSPMPSPQPARRRLPPAPAIQSQSYHGSHAAHKLAVPEPSMGRRSSSPSCLSAVNLQQSSMLWRELPEVRNSSELKMLTEDQRRLQEVRFEVITSEALYCRSLGIFVKNFVNSTELEKLLTNNEKIRLFSRLGDVHAVSNRFLTKLKDRLESNIMSFSVCDIIVSQCDLFKKVYVPYLTNQSYQDDTYERLMNENVDFKRFVENTERNPDFQRRSLRSFLVLPFQRITRLKLLVHNILNKTPSGTIEATYALKALQHLEKMIQNSNDKFSELKNLESLATLSRKIEFEGRTFPLISNSRRLVREGPLTELMDGSQKEKERQLYLHLFNDYLLVSIKKEGGRFMAIDHCPVQELNAKNVPVKLLSLRDNLFQLQLRKEKPLTLRVDSESDKLRWISALSRHHRKSIDYSMAEEYVQMQCIRPYVAQQPDEMSLEKADIILVHPDKSDDWVEGTKVSDLLSGWVPRSHMEIITNVEVRQRNLSDVITLRMARAAI